jgi:VWFA-related protein
MINRALQVSILLFGFSGYAIAQGMVYSKNQVSPQTLASMDARGPGPDPLADFNLWSVGDGGDHSPLQGPSGSISALDLEAPRNARQEYNKGYLLLMRKDLDGAVEHLTTALSYYPRFVAAHNALGSAYLQMGQNNAARDQFAQAVALDDHLPGSYLNLGSAQVALKDYRSAEESVKRASSLAPLDLQVATALAYVQLMNKDYRAVIATAGQVHGRKHKGAAMVHYYAAAASQDLNNPQETQRELETFLREDPKSKMAEQARLVLDQIKDQAGRDQQIKEAEQKNPKPAASPATLPHVHSTQAGPTPEQVAERQQLAAQEAKEETQIAEAEAADFGCATCDAAGSPRAGAAAQESRLDPGTESAESAAVTPYALRKVVDEVAVFFTATDRGKSVTDLTSNEVGVLDDNRPPAAITGFLSEADLPLRLGIVIDTSQSVTGQFSFEQRAAIDFMRKVLTGTHDLGFVVGVANSVLLVQDFTSQQQQISHAVDQLAPGGGTALWDAVTFAATKLADQAETQPVARVLVVISDGNDNSSSATLKEAIGAAEGGGVFVYTVVACDVGNGDQQPFTDDHAPVGIRAMRVLAERTGGAAFVPNSLQGLNHGLDEAQQVIRSRYMISYRPADFKRDGEYRPIDITVQKSGRKLRVYARRGYYARSSSEGQPSSSISDDSQPR